jgi:hypothetical protein
VIEDEGVDSVAGQSSNRWMRVVGRHADHNPLFVARVRGVTNHRVEGNPAAGQRRPLRKRVEDTHDSRIMNEE